MTDRILRVSSGVLMCALGLLILNPVVHAEEERECFLQGTWTSNEAFTLASLDQTTDLPAHMHELWRDDFFGNMSFEFTCETVTTNYVGTVAKADYRVLDLTSEEVVIQIEQYGELKTETLTLNPDKSCYLVPIRDFGFSEYFCREK